MKIDRRVDQYIINAAPFAQPILNHLRQIIHTTVPDVVETIKWGFPNFENKGKILCSFAAFKKHCAFGFWNGKDLPDPDGILEQVGKTAMGFLGKITSLEDLPADKILIKYIKNAVKISESLIENPVKTPIKKETKALLIPDYFLKALKTNLNAKQTFDAFSYSCKKEYVEWVTDAKTEATRNKRMLSTIEMLAEGKQKNWKYQK
ncbi:MAG: DUF1801 domain-containing protein [Bacteroidota bacterium]